MNIVEELLHNDYDCFMDASSHITSFWLSNYKNLDDDILLISDLILYLSGREK